MKAIINGIIKNSSVDGPGNRLVVFFQGCNIDCSYCHNPETINFCDSCGACIKNCPVGALELLDSKVLFNKDRCIHCDSCIKVCNKNSSPKAISYTLEELVNVIKKYKVFLRGVTFSGGECTLHSNYIIAISKELKKIALDIYIDTNGKWAYESMKELIEDVDKFMLDIKAWNSDDHIKLTGKDNDDILTNFKILMKQNKIYEVRTVVVPNYIDNELTVKEVSKLIKNSDVRYKLISFRKHGVRNAISFESPSKEYMLHLKKIARKNGVKEIIII